MVLQYEPCNKVGSGEAQAREEVLPVSEHALHAVHPAGFENAARQEHQNEAAALRNLQEQAVCLTSLLDLPGSPILQCEHALHAVHPPGFNQGPQQLEHKNEAAALRNLQEQALRTTSEACRVVVTASHTLGRKSCFVISVSMPQVS